MTHIMAHHPMHLTPDYALPGLSDFGSEQYLHEETSTNSSPSPVMWALPDQYVPQPEHMGFDPSYEQHTGYPYFDPACPAPIVEFTDLTAPYQEDRRRRRTQVKDKQAISTMHMRRRAQNRASQRAFRERKEKHAQDLQSQLDELDARHKSLQQSHDVLGSTNKKLVEELNSLRSRISTVQASHDDIRCSLLTEEAGRFKEEFPLEDTAF